MTVELSDAEFGQLLAETSAARAQSIDVESIPETEITVCEKHEHEDGSVTLTPYGPARTARAIVREREQRRHAMRQRRAAAAAYAQPRLAPVCTPARVPARTARRARGAGRPRAAASRSSASSGDSSDLSDEVRFLGALVALVDDGWIELRTIVAGSRARQAFVPVAEVERAAECAIELAQLGDVYVSAIPRVRERGRAGDVGPATAVWCDLDSPEALAALDTFTPPPSFVIATSEGKAHAWWLLAEPADAAEVVKLNRDLAHALGGDIASTDAARILRVPGTLNHKHSPPYRVELTRAGEERYSFAELRAAVPVHDEHGPATTTATDVSGSLAERIREYQSMAAGDGRNVHAASIFGGLLRRDGQAAAELIFRSINAAALDPLPGSRGREARALDRPRRGGEA